MTILEIIVSAIDHASDVIEGIADKSGETFSFMEEHWVEVGIAAAAAGVAIEANAREQALLTQTTGNLAASLGVTEDQIRNVALEYVGLGDPMEEILGLMEMGRKQGLDNAEALGAYYQAWDAVGDATGENAEQLAKAGAALRAVGIEADETEQAYAAFGFITRETSGTVGEFLQFVQRSGPYIRDMGLDINDTAAIMGALEKEMGYTSRTARTEFQQAVNDVQRELEGANVSVGKIQGEMAKLDQQYAAGKITSSEYASAQAELKSKLSAAKQDVAKYTDAQGMLLEKLGLSKDQFDKYKQAVADSSGVIEEQAGIQEKTYTLTEKLAWEVEKLRYKYGDFGKSIAEFAPIMASVGPIIKGVSMAKSAMTAVTTMETAATWGLVTAQLALLAPYIAIAAAIAALIIVLWYLYENWDEVVTAICEIGGKIWEFFGGLWEGLLELFGGGFEGILGILFPPFGIYEMVKDNWGPITEFLGKLWDGALDIFGKAWDGIVAALFPAKGLGDMVEDNWGGIQEFVGKLWDKIVEFFGKGFENAIRVMFPAIGLIELVFKNWGPITQAVENIWDSVVWIFKSFYNTASSYGRDIVMGLWDGIFSLYSWIHDQVTGFGESILGWVTDGLGALWPNSPSEAGVKIGAGLTAGIEKGLGDTLTTVRRAIDGLEDEMVVDANPTVGMPIGGSQGGIRVEAGAGVQEVHYHFDGTFHIREEADIHKLAYELERMRSTKARMRGIGTW